MNIAVLMGVFFVLLFLGVPIAYSLCLSAVLYMALFMDVPMIIIGQQMLKGVDSFTLMAIPFFVIAGGLMESGGISKRIVNFARTVVGHLPGGLAIVTVVASMIFAAMTGAGAATTAAVGGIMIPSMQEEGYDGGYASAVQAVGGIFGPLIPPSILMVLYGVASGESVGDMLLAGLVPGLFLGVIVIAVVVWQCIKKGYKGVGHFNLKRAAKSFLDAIWAILAPAIILGGIYSGLFTPTEASAVACFYCLIIGLFVYRELNFKSLGEGGIQISQDSSGYHAYSSSHPGIWMGPDKGRNTPDGGRRIYFCNIKPNSVYVCCCIHSDCCGVFHRCSTGIADFCSHIDSYSNPVWNFFDSFRCGYGGYLMYWTGDASGRN